MTDIKIRIPPELLEIIQNDERLWTERDKFKKSNDDNYTPASATLILRLIERYCETAPKKVTGDNDRFLRGKTGKGIY